MDIKSARFIISNTDIAKCPSDGRPEYAFIGRSNVGKSSLINMLTRNGKLAMTSSMPGKTLLINHFLVNNECRCIRGNVDNVCNDLRLDRAILEFSYTSSRFNTFNCVHIYLQLYLNLLSLKSNTKSFQRKAYRTRNETHKRLSYRTAFR